MSRIKICGLSREEDICYVNEAGADYAGFIIDFPKSHRNVSPEKVKALRSKLDEQIQAVGVFVDQPECKVAKIAATDRIDLIQLHGEEDESYIRRLRADTDKPIIKAFQIQGLEDIQMAEESNADYILLDSGQGTGRPFDWKLLDKIQRPFFLAGGLSPSNIEEAVFKIQPFAVDVSSGVEIEKQKDREKIIAAVRAAHKERSIDE